jgi:hypothetical protein
MLVVATMVLEIYTLLYDHCVWKLYFLLAPLSTTLGKIHETRLINQYTLGNKTSLVPSSTAFTHSRATYSAFNAPLRLSLTSPKSTAEPRKSPSTVAGQTMEKPMRGCSIERDRYRIKEAAFVDPYSERVGAGMMEAIEDIWQIEGEGEVDSNIGICIVLV